MGCFEFEFNRIFCSHIKKQKTKKSTVCTQHIFNLSQVQPKQATIKCLFINQHLLYFINPFYIYFHTVLLNMLSSTYIKINMGNVTIN